MPDLHAGFRVPQRTESPLLEEFLHEVDRLPSVQALHAAMRRELGLRPGMRVLDAGCGIGLEITRLAEAHPDIAFVGLPVRQRPAPADRSAGRRSPGA